MKKKSTNIRKGEKFQLGGILLQSSRQSPKSNTTSVKKNVQEYTPSTYNNTSKNISRRSLDSQQKYIDSVFQANNALPWVKGLYDKNYGSIQLPGQKGTSTHFMESSDGMVYPTIVKNPEGKLEYLGEKARDYAVKNKQFIKFPDDKTAMWFGKNYKLGTGVLPEYQFGGNLPGAVGNMYARIGAPSNGKKAKKTKPSAQTGGIIEDNAGQWAHPGEVTKINSNQITMKGVNYPVLGISDTGHKQMMLPGQEYKFDGDSVTEYPSIQDKGQLKKLDQLTNFTNMGKAKSGKKLVKKGLKKADDGYTSIGQFEVSNPEDRLRSVVSSLGTGYEGGIKGLKQQQKLMFGTQTTMDKLGGAQGIMNTGEQLAGGVMMAINDRKENRSAAQMSAVSDVTLAAAGSRPEKTKRKYTRPEDAIIDTNQMFPTYGTGSGVLAKNGAEIANTFAPHDIYEDLGYEPLHDSEKLKSLRKAQWGEMLQGLGADQVGSMGSGLGSLLNGGRGKQTGAGSIGGTIGGLAGTIFGGPLGGVIGKGIGSAIGGLVGGNQERQTRDYTNHAYANLSQAATQQSAKNMQLQNSSFMQQGGKVPSTLNGELQVLDGGYAETLSQNPYLPGGGETVMFRGKSHANGGMPVQFGKSGVEVEGGEPAVKLQNNEKDSSLTVFGNMKIPSYGVTELNDKNAKGKKFKNYIADLSKKEASQNKISDKGVDMVNNSAEKSSPFETLKLTTGKVMMEGSNMKLKDIAKKKQLASIIQNAILETADEHGLESDALAEGKMKKAKNGAKLKAQDGTVIRPNQKEEYKLYGFQEDPNNPNQMFRDLVTKKGDVKTIKSGEYKAGSKEFQAAFADARKKKLGQFDFNGKKYTTDLWKGNTKTVATPDQTARDYVSIKDERPPYLGEDYTTTPVSLASNVTSEQQTQEEVQKQRFPWENIASSVMPLLRPTNQRRLDPNQLSGEMYALSNNQLESVQSQQYQPLLETPYKVSYQDIRNQNQADFNANARLTGNNPAAQASLAAQKYAANASVTGQEFRENQGRLSDVIARNRGTLNDATLKNLAILDEQYQRQSTAKSNTKAIAQSVLSSIADKIQRNKLENRTLGVYENLYNYRFGPNGHAWNFNGPASFNVPQVGAPLQNTDEYGRPLLPAGYDNNNKPNKYVVPKEPKKGKYMLAKRSNGGIVRAIKSL